MASRHHMATLACSLWVCLSAGAVAADSLGLSDQLSPIEPVLLTALVDSVGTEPAAFSQRSLTVGPLTLPQPGFADVLGMVLPKPVAPWNPGPPPPTLADVISVVNLANWHPCDPHPCDPLNPLDGWGGGHDSVIAEASAVWRAHMAAYLAQTAQSNAQQMNAFSAAVKTQFDIAMDPDRSPFDDLAISELMQDGGSIMSEFEWGRGDMRHVESVFAKFRKSESGFFGG
jgi:hypothetical protein